jgi:hypothetical protein
LFSIVFAKGAIQPGPIWFNVADDENFYEMPFSNDFGRGCGGPLTSLAWFIADMGAGAGA